MNDQPTLIVGVMPRGFGRGSPDTDLWLPLTIDRARAERGGRTLNVVGRLADDADVDTARAEMDAIGARLAGAFPAENGGWGVTLVRLEDAAVGAGVKRALYILLSAVGFVLLIACVNVANLLSARGVARHRELAIRAALGAGRWRLIRQLLTESAALALVGGVLGVFLATWGAELLLALAPADIPRIEDVGIDGRVLLAGLVATLAAALIFGLAPALQSSALRPDDALKETTRCSQSRGRRLSQVFVVAGVALAVVLLVGAGLLLRTFVRLSSQSIGFDPDHTLVFSLSLPEARYPSPASVSAFHRSVLERVRALPGCRLGRGDACAPVLRHGQRARVRPRWRAARLAESAERRIPAGHARLLRGDGDTGQAGARVHRRRYRRRAGRDHRERVVREAVSCRRAARAANPPGRQRRRPGVPRSIGIARR